MNELEFKVNEYITLKLQYGKTNIYVKNKLFKQCKFLLLNIPVENINKFDEIQSINEATELLDKSMEGRSRNISNYPEEQDDLANQKNRRTLILDGVNARKFAVHTIYYPYQDQINEFKSSIKINCPNCKELLELNDIFCDKCGKVNVE